MDDPTLTLDGGHILLESSEVTSPPSSKPGSPAKAEDWNWDFSAETPSLAPYRPQEDPTLQPPPLPSSMIPGAPLYHTQQQQQQQHASPPLSSSLPVSSALTSSSIGKREDVVTHQPRPGMSTPPMSPTTAARGGAGAGGDATKNEGGETHRDLSNSPAKGKHRRQRSLSHSDLSEPIGPLFSGVAPGSLSPKDKHSYTPRRPLHSLSSSGLATASSIEALGSNSSLPKLSLTPPTAVLKDTTSSPLERTLASGRQKFCEFLTSLTCYDIIPQSGKIVVFDTQLLVKKAFFALVQNGIRSAPLWDSKRQQFVGMITITDFILILRHYYVSPLVAMEELEEQNIQTWRDLSNEKRPEQLVCIDPMESLYSAVRMLIDFHIHRLPVIDRHSGNAVTILTHKRVLLFLMANISKESIPMLKCTIRQLGLGTTKNIATITPDTPLISALNIFVERRVSALPIIDKSGCVIDIYAKHDAINLARERTYNNLDVSVVEALAHRSDFEGVQTCVLDSTLGEVLEQIVSANVHRLVIVDGEKRLVGILSLSDLLGFLIGPAS